MRRSLSILCMMIGFCSLLMAQEQPATLFAEGNKAYSDGNYEQAAEAYQQILDQGYESAEVYYNLGNAWYRMGESGLAVLNYERAHRMRPTDREITQNLEFAYAHTEDKIEELPQLFFVKWWKGLVACFNTRGWMWVCLACLTLALGALLWFLLSRDYRVRKYSFIATVVMAAVWLVSALATVSASAWASSQRQAIVTVPMSVVKSSPSESSVDKFILHDGTKVELLDQVDDWHKVRRADGNIGWMRDGDYTLI